MGILSDWNWALDGWIVAAGVLCAIASSLLGNFLVLRRMSMLGDAISHAVLPGLAAAFLISGSRNSIPMFLGAVVVGVLTAMFTEWIRGVGRVDEGASMGVVFTSLFALGLVMIVQAADHVDLDPSCVLYGAIELTPLDTVSLGPLDIPRVVLTLGVVMLVNATFIMVSYKELKISSFDPALATASGVHAGLMHYLLMILVAVTAVASFESVGNVLVVAMFVVPPAAAYMLTDRLPRMIVVSAVLAALSAILGHVGALAVPAWFGFQSTSTAGMMAVAAGVMLGLAILFSPRHGVLVKLIRQRKLAWRILADDVVALLYRFDEREEHSQATPASLADALLIDRFTLGLTIRWLRLSGSVLWRTEASGGWCELTARGRERARELVRSHRLWEQYLISQAGVESERIHDKAERYEHFTDVAMRDLLDAETNAPRIDPHGSPIPREHESR
ncbi:MAG: metal ABC transporter permease [Planctomycetales bacterium]|nr:metal ABC transporter permease [Planctomycetales bacterium]